MSFPKFNRTPPHLKEAMALMKSGRLKEATKLIQNNLSGSALDESSGANPMRDVTPDKSKLADKRTAADKPTSADKPSNKPSNKPSSKTSSKPSNKLSDKLQNFSSKIQDFKLDLPSAINIGGLSTGLKTHSEPTIPQNAQFLKAMLKSSQGTHDYRLYIPSNYDQALEHGMRVPLIVMLHGCTQSPEDFAVGTRMNDLAEEHQCLIVYPSQPTSANLNRCWNWFNPHDQKRDQGEPAWLAALTRSVIKDYAVDPAQVYIAGLSAGAAMAVIMTQTHPDLYAAVGVHSGLAYGSASDLPSAMMAMRKGGKNEPSLQDNHNFVPMIIFHGDQDHTVSIRNGEQIFELEKAHLQAQKSNLKTVQHKYGSKQNHRSTWLEVCDDKGLSQLEYWKIHGAGHSWAGGDSAGSYTDPKGPDASKEMLRFFLSHSS